MKPFSLQARHKKIIEIDRLKQERNTTDKDYKDDYLDVNAVGLDLTEFIYRIFKYEYFLNDLNDGKLTLVHPGSWDDPFENFLLNSRGQLDDGTFVDLSSIRDSFFSQCWTTKAECDGMWRNYRSEKDGFSIKVKVSSRKLFDKLYKIDNPFHYLSYFIGKVEYVTENEIASCFQDKIDFTNFQSGIELASTLLLKRTAFSYEEEVRIIVNDQSASAEKLLRIDLDLKEVVEQIVFDPWSNHDLVKAKEKELIEAGFKGEIIKSSLYDSPFFTVKL